MPRVPGYPLSFGNGCRAPVLIRVNCYKTVKNAPTLSNYGKPSLKMKSIKYGVNMCCKNKVFWKKGPHNWPTITLPKKNWASVLWKPYHCPCKELRFYENEIYSFFSRSKYQERDPSGVVANWIGLLIVVFCVLVIYLVANPRFKRLTRPEDEMLLTDRDGN